MTPLPGPANSSLEDADEAAAVYLVSHMEQLASELQSATIEETRLKQQLEYDQMKIQQLERSLEEPLAFSKLHGVPVFLDQVQTWWSRRSQRQSRQCARVLS